MDGQDFESAERKGKTQKRYVPLLRISLHPHQGSEILEISQVGISENHMNNIQYCNIRTTLRSEVRNNDSRNSRVVDRVDQLYDTVRKARQMRVSHNAYSPRLEDLQGDSQIFRIKSSFP